MSKFFFSFLLFLTGMMAGITPAVAVKPEEKCPDELRIKAAVARLGVGPNARVKVELRSEVTLQGIVGRADEESFVLLSTEHGSIGVAIQIAYCAVCRRS